MEDKKFYLTKEGLKEIKKKYKELKKVRRDKSREGIPQFLQSEEVNPEYLVLQDDINMLEEQIAEFKKIMRTASIIRPPSRKNRNSVHLGAVVLVENNKGKNDEFQIVGPLESDPSLGKISNESPVGRSLLGSKVGEKVVVQTAVKTIYKIKKIRYK